MRTRTYSPRLARILVSVCVGGAIGAFAAVAQERGQQEPDTPPASRTVPPPSAPEESATIQDDPIIAPDAEESADHNVSFPVDI